jgi:hypothetical protein
MVKEPSVRYHPHGDGYVKVYRKLLTSAVFQNEKLLKVWIWCLIRANWTESPIFFDGEEITLQRGQFVTGRFTGSEQCNMNPKTFYNQLQKLAEMNNIVLVSDNRKTKISIVNYESYQDDIVSGWTTSGQPMDNRRTTDGQLVDTDKNIRSKEVKKGKKIPPTLEEVQNLFKERNYPQSEAEKFFNYYQSNGWRVGKNPMKDWAAAATNWSKNIRNYGGVVLTPRKASTSPAPLIQATLLCNQHNIPYKDGELCPECKREFDLQPGNGSAKEFGEAISKLSKSMAVEKRKDDPNEQYRCSRL